LAIWTDVDSVKQHLGDAKNAKGYTDTDLTDAITKAERYLRPFMVGALGETEVKLWISKAATPESVQDLTAMWAAAKILESFGGQSLHAEGDKAHSLWKDVEFAIKGIQNGSFQLVYASGVTVGGATVLPTSSTKGKTPTFSMGNEGDGSEGSLDNF